MVASQVGAVRRLEAADQRILTVGDDFRLPCSDSDDDVLSVGPVWPLSMATSLGGARMDDDCRLQADSLNEVLSVEAWAAANRHETCCVQLDNFYWVVPPYDCAMMLPRPELDDESSDVERDVCDVPDEFLVCVDKTAVELLGLPVVVQTRLQVGCDWDFESSDVGRDVCYVPDEFPVGIDKVAVELFTCGRSDETAGWL